MELRPCVVGDVDWGTMYAFKKKAYSYIRANIHCAPKFDRRLSAYLLREAGALRRVRLANCTSPESRGGRAPQRYDQKTKVFVHQTTAEGKYGRRNHPKQNNVHLCEGDNRRECTCPFFSPHSSCKWWKQGASSHFGFGGPRWKNLVGTISKQQAAR